MIRDQVLKTWNPPRLTGKETLADAAQTSVILTIAFIFGKEFVGPLTQHPPEAIESGIKLFETVLN
jgi:hypothetical protein